MSGLFYLVLLLLCCLRRLLLRRGRFVLSGFLCDVCLSHLVFGLSSMADSIIGVSEKINLSEEEVTVVGEELVDKSDPNDDSRISLLVFGKVMAPKVMKFASVKALLLLVWTLRKGVSVRRLGDNLGAFQFFHEADKRKVLEGRPWHYDNHLIVLDEAMGHLLPSEIDFNHCPFWVRVDDVPIVKRNKLTAKAIGDALGSFFSMTMTILWRYLEV